MVYGKTYRKQKEDISFALSKTADLIAPFCILTGCVIMLSYILELLLGYGNTSAPGETSVSGGILYSVSELLKDALLPVAGGITALVLSGNNALPAGILGGIISAGGYSFFTPQGSINSTSGLFGALLAGVTAGVSAKIAERIIDKQKTKKTAEIGNIIIVAVSLSVTVTAMLFVTSFSAILGLGFSFVPPILLNYNQPLLFFALGIMLNINLGNTIYVAAFAFSSSMLSIGDESYTAAVVSASLAPVAAVIILNIFYPEKFSLSQKICGLAGLLFAVGGVNISVIPILIKKPLRYSFCFSFGGAVASMLSYYSGCRLESFEGGFLVSRTLTNTLLMLLSVLCGGVVSAAADAVFEYLGDKRTQKKVDKNSFGKAVFE